MNHSVKLDRALPLLLCCVIFGGVLFGVSWKMARAAAGCGQAPFAWCSWDIKIDFSEDRLRVIYTVSVGDYKGMTPIVIAQQSLDISERCRQLGGAIMIKAAVAYFDGGYYECERPSFAEIVRELTDGQVQLPDTCECKSPAAAFHGAFAASGRQPLLYREDGRFYVTINRPEDVTTTLATGSLKSSPIAYTSDRWLLTQQITLWAGPLDDSLPHFTRLQLPSGWFDFLQNPAKGSAPPFMTAISKGAYGSFLHWHEGAAPTYQPAQGSMPLHTDSQLFYIGYDPSTGDVFRGALQNLWDDPGCFGNK